MNYEFTTGAPITEEAALAEAAALGLHAIAFDLTIEHDETLHWHEFGGVTWVIDGTGAFADEHGTVTQVQLGCRVQAPAGWLHRNFAGSARVVLATDLPYSEWTAPIDKDPADRPASLSGAANS